MIRNQQTLAGSLKLVGKALHSGRIVTVEMHPADDNFGIKFRRTDIVGARAVNALANEVSDTRLSTAIGPERSQISTIEHLMAAFVGMGIDNALVLVDGPELPILDGSSAKFVQAIRSVGLKRQKDQKRIHHVKDVIEIREGDKFIRIEPSKKLRFDVSIDFGQRSFIGKQLVSWAFSHSGFLDIATARTFCHLSEVEAMKRQGLALGGSLNNAVVVTDDGVLNNDGLRHADEFVRHKILDLIGDLALVGFPIVGKITAHKPGHCLNARFANALLNGRQRFLEERSSGLSVDAAAQDDLISPMPIYAT